MNGVLIVEDNDGVRGFFKAFIEHTKKFDLIDAVCTGEEALALFEKDKYSLVIMDIGLQKMSGAEACFLMRQKDKAVKIVAVTGHAKIGEDLRVLAGFDAMFIKAIQYREFLDYIQAL